MFFFSKMQATGNDFIIINNLENEFEYSFKLLYKYLCDRHFGVGADGILILDKGTNAEYKMRIFNQDGSEAEMCGNGIRCFAKYLYEKKLVESEEFEIETLAGIKNVKLKVEGKTVTFVEVSMGKPTLEFSKIPVYYENNNEDIYQEEKAESTYDEVIEDVKGIKIDDFTVYPISIGNPHCVCFVDNVDNIDIEKSGKLIENYKYFPNKMNVEFVEIKNENSIKVRVWERGVGETLACGTGACAASVISNIYKSTNSEVSVELKGGTLKIDYNNENIYLKGTAEFVFEGEIEI